MRILPRFEGMRATRTDRLWDELRNTENSSRGPWSEKPSNNRALTRRTRSVSVRSLSVGNRYPSARGVRAVR